MLLKTLKFLCLRKINFLIFVFCVLVLALSIGILAPTPLHKPKIINNHVNAINPNLSIENMNLQSLFKCKWWKKEKNESEQSAIRRSKFITTDCSNYYPPSFAKRFFIYYKNINKVSGTGVVVKAEGSNEYIIPSVIEASSIDVFNTLDAIQKSLLSSQQNTPVSLFQKMSSEHNRIVIIYELPEHTKIDTIYLGALRRSRKIELVNKIFVEGQADKNLQLTMGYISPGANVKRVINDIDKGNQQKMKRYVNFINRPYNVGGDTLNSEYSFTKNLSITEWNKKAFPKNLISINACKEYIKKNLGIQTFQQVEKFCEYLGNVYSTNSFYAKNDFVFDPNDTKDFLGDFINPVIDGKYSLTSLPWDLIFFPHKKAVFQNFNLIAMGELFLQKLFTKYVNRNDDYKLRDLTLKNLNLSVNTIETFLLDFFNKGQLEVLDFSNNQVPYSTLQTIINQPNLKKLILIDNFIDASVLDLENLKALEDLEIRTSSFPTVRLKSRKLKRLVMKNIGVNQIVGLRNTQVINSVNLDDNNLESIHLAPFTKLKMLSAKKNNIREFILERTQEIESIDLSDNNIKRFSITSGNFLKKLYISNNNLISLNLASNSLDTLIASNNNLSNLTLNTKSLERLNLEGNKNVQKLLQTIHFQAPKLKYLNLSDTNLTLFNSSWIGTNDNNLELVLSNTNDIQQDDNTISNLSLTTLPNLTKAFLANMGLTTLTISNANKLQQLVVAKNKITVINYDGSSLKSLDISDSTPTQKIFDLIISKSQTLVNLNISNTTSNWGYVFEKASFPELKTLSASKNDFLEVPLYFNRLRNQIKSLNLSNNNIRNRFDAFSYSQLEYLDLSGNKNILAIINLGGASILKELKISHIPKILDRITEGNNNLEKLDISHTETKIVRPLKSLFPNIISIDISGNRVQDIFELVGSKTKSISTSLNTTNEIIKALPSIKDIYYFDATFNFLGFVSDLVVNNNAYVIHLNPKQIVLKGDMKGFDRWFKDLLGKRVFLLDEKGDTISLNPQIIDRYFQEFSEKYGLKKPIEPKIRQYFKKLSPILSSNDLNSAKKSINLFLMTQYPDIVQKYESKVGEYKKSPALKSSDLNNTLSDFRYILYSLLASVIVMGIIIVIITGKLLRSRRN